MIKGCRNFQAVCGWFESGRARQYQWAKGGKSNTLAHISLRGGTPMKYIAVASLALLAGCAVQAATQPALNAANTSCAQGEKKACAQIPGLTSRVQGENAANAAASSAAAAAVGVGIGAGLAAPAYGYGYPYGYPYGYRRYGYPYGYYPACGPWGC
jgi:hypothetical protein